MLNGIPIYKFFISGLYYSFGNLKKKKKRSVRTFLLKKIVIFTSFTYIIPKSGSQFFVRKPKKKRRKKRLVTFLKEYNKKNQLPDLLFYLNSKVRFVLFVRQPKKKKKKRSVRNVSQKNKILSPPSTYIIQKSGSFRPAT